MNKFFRKIPLQGQLMLIGLVPVLFLIYLTVQVYNEKTEKLAIFDNYKTYIAESAHINELIDALQEERKYSFDYAMTKSMYPQLVLQRPRTDALINKITNSGDPSTAGLTKYTKLGELNAIRKRVDNQTANPNDVMHFYSNTVFRLNTLNTIPPANTAYLKPVYKDLVSQKILSEMITYLGIIRSNIYNVLHTRQYMIETLIGTVGTHDIYKSYESELLVKASPETVSHFKTIRDTTALKPTMEYIDTLFKSFKFDDTYKSTEWWKVSNEGNNALRSLQDTIHKRIVNKIDTLYAEEKKAQSITLLLLVIALISVTVVVCYIVYIISKTLRKLRIATERISEGETSVAIDINSDDVIGNLAKSISRIDKNNQSIAHAAMAIGIGNFEVEVIPRSEKDVLGHAILQMKDELRQYSDKMEHLVNQRTEDLERSNEDLRQFAHVASHDMKEPLRKIATFSNMLQHEQYEMLSDRGKVYLDKIELASQRMSSMIEGVLAYSTMAANEKAFEVVDLNKILSEVESDLELAIIQKSAAISYGRLPKIIGIPVLLHQLFYNLISNALKFSKEGVPPMITITTADIEKPNESDKAKSVAMAHISVCDNGIGFGQQHAEQMFDVFSRLNPKDKYEGTGLGLALCRKIAYRHKGEIYAEGTEGQGACFHVILPKK